MTEGAGVPELICESARKRPGGWMEEETSKGRMNVVHLGHILEE